MTILLLFFVFNMEYGVFPQMNVEGLFNNPIKKLGSFSSPIYTLNNQRDITLATEVKKASSGTFVCLTWM